METSTRLIEFLPTSRSQTTNHFSIFKMRSQMDQTWYKPLDTFASSSRKRESSLTRLKEEDLLEATVLREAPLITELLLPLTTLSMIRRLPT